MKTPLVSIIIVNWNGLDYLKTCFDSLKQQNYPNIEILLVDNASTDNSIDWVKKRAPNTRIILNQKNLGFAESNNLGFTRSKGEFVFFLNNDTSLHKNAIYELVSCLKSDIGVGGAQSKLLLMDRPTHYDSIGAYLTPTGFLYHNAFGERDTAIFDKEIDLYSAKGAAMMFKKKVLKKIEIQGKIFDSEYFAYFEETDLCHRVWLSGYRIVYAYKSIVYHKMGATSKSMNNAFIQFHSFKNRIRTYLKNFTDIELLTILPLHLILCEFYALYLFIRGQTEVFVSINRAILWNIQNLSNTVYLRKLIWKRANKKLYNYYRSRIIKFPSPLYFVRLMVFGY